MKLVGWLKSPGTSSLHTFGRRLLIGWGRYWCDGLVVSAYRDLSGWSIHSGGTSILIISSKGNFDRYEALERSLLAVEGAAAAWKNRAFIAEDILRQVKESGTDVVASSKIAEQFSGGGRLEMLAGSETRIKDLLENGPRRETPDWMKRRIQSGQQGLPPMQPISITAEVEAMIPLQLPSPEDVWDVANAKVKDDKYTAQAAEKEALDKQRKALERALQTKSIKKLVRYPEDAEGKLGKLSRTIMHFAILGDALGSY